MAVRDKAAELGLTDRLTVILGEEVSTADGEVVGVFLQRTIPRGLTADETADEIHAQGGLVSIPHPYDPFRASHIREEPLMELAGGRQDRHDRGLQQPRDAPAATTTRPPSSPRVTGSRGSPAATAIPSFEVAMSFNALPAFATADELRAALAENEWHGSRSTVLIHLTTRWAVWSNIVRNWLGRDTAAAPVLGPEPPQKVEEEPVERPSPRSCPTRRIRRRRVTEDSRPPTDPAARPARAPPPEHPTGPHEHGHSVYEPGEFLDAPPEEAIPEREVSLARRFLNLRTIGSIVFGLVLVFLLFRVVLNVDFGAPWS